MKINKKEAGNGPLKKLRQKPVESFGLSAAIHVTYAD